MNFTRLFTYGLNKLQVITPAVYGTLNKNIYAYIPIAQAFSCKSCNNLAKIKYQTYSTIEPKAIAEEKSPILKRILTKLKSFNIEKYRLGVKGYLLYQSVADNLNHLEFFEEFSLPDTFYSWFAITELHLWMLSVRLMAEGENGTRVRNSMVEALWKDVGFRSKQLRSANPSAMKTQILDLSEQLQAALLAYDEGLQSDDIVLAGAIWRRIYQRQDVNVEHLENLVKYIRRQILLLDNATQDEVLSSKNPWVPWKSKVSKDTI